MSYSRTSYDEVEPRAPGMHFLRDELDCENLGVTVIDADEGWEGMEHGHGDQGHEEVYVLIYGGGRLTVEEEEVDLEPGDAVRVDPDSTRQLSFDQDSVMVVAGAP